MKETRLPDGVTAIVTNPPYGPSLWQDTVQVR
jgi:tRNA G10  N-methylase Trm11